MLFKSSNHTSSVLLYLLLIVKSSTQHVKIRYKYFKTLEKYFYNLKFLRFFIMFKIYIITIALKKH